MKLSKIAKHWNKGKTNTYVKGGSDFTGKLRFDIGEPLLQLTPKLNNLINNWSINDFKNRPDIHCINLRKAASKFWNISVDSIAAANGSDQFIWLLPRLFMDRGDTAITIDPTFFLFSEAVERNNGKIISITTSRVNNFNVTEKIIQRVIIASNKNATKIIWLCNPNNPTGTTISLNAIKKIAQNTDALVVVDEAFFDISDLPSDQSAIHLVNKGQKDVLVLKSLSKTFGLSNVRIGFAFGSTDLVNMLNDWRLPFDVSGIAQITGSILFDDLSHWGKVKEKILEEKKLFLNKLININNIELASLSSTTIFLLRHKNIDLFRSLLRNKIITADFNNCRGIEGLGFVRISVQNRESNSKLVRILKRI